MSIRDTGGATTSEPHAADKTLCGLARLLEAYETMFFDEAASVWIDEPEVALEASLQTTERMSREDVRIGALADWCAQRGLRLSLESVKRFIIELGREVRETPHDVQFWGLDRVMRATPEMERLLARAVATRDPVITPAARTVHWLIKTLPEIHLRDGDTPAMGARRAKMASAIMTDPNVREIRRWATLGNMDLNAESVKILALRIAQEFFAETPVVARLGPDQGGNALAKIGTKGDGAAPDAVEFGTLPWNVADWSLDQAVVALPKLGFEGDGDAIHTVMAYGVLPWDVASCGFYQDAGALPKLGFEGDPPRRTFSGGAPEVKAAAPEVQAAAPEVQAAAPAAVARGRNPERTAMIKSLFMDGVPLKEIPVRIQERFGGKMMSIDAVDKNLTRYGVPRDRKSSKRK